MSLDFDGTNDYVDMGTFNMPAVSALSVVACILPITNSDKMIIS